jgi:hypothetical protein
MRGIVLVTVACVAMCVPALAAEQLAQTPWQAVAQRGGTCQTVSSCREAVELWCGGYRRADGDGDGIPCENVCRSLSQVEAIKKEIDC